MSDTKKVSIEGLNNKYLMKKVLRKLPTEPEEKKNLNSNINYTEEENLYFLSCLDDVDKFKENDIQSYKLLSKNMSIKRSGYKVQDIKKKIFIEKEFISGEEILNLMKNCKLNCYYCNLTCLLFYKFVRDPKQWTLDRIDNSIGHNVSNVVISCLKCNLKRRNKDKDKFFQGSNFNLIKLN